MLKKSSWSKELAIALAKAAKKTNSNSMVLKKKKSI
jgi:hypothetical protein